MINKLTLVSILNISSGIIFWLLLILFYDTSSTADIILSQQALYTTFYFVSMLFSEQFIIKVKQVKYAISITYSLMIIIFTLILVIPTMILMKNYIVDIFSSSKNLILIKENYYKLVFIVALHAVYINLEKLLNIIDDFMSAFLFLIVPNLATSLVLVFYNDVTTLPNIVLDVRIISSISVLAFLTLLTFKKCYDVLPSKHDIDLAFLASIMWSSFKMRACHNMHNFLVTPVIFSVLTTLPTGSVSSYSYAQKFITILKEIVLGPHYKKYFKEMVFRRDENLFNQYWLMLQKRGLIIILSAYISLLFLYFQAPKIAFDLPIDTVITCIALLPWLLLVMRESRYLPELISLDKPKIFLISNTIFILNLILWVQILKHINWSINIFYLPIIIFICQFLSFLFLVNMYRKLDS